LKTDIPKSTLILGDHPRFPYQRGASPSPTAPAWNPEPFDRNGSPVARLRRGPESVRSALTTRISPSCANPAAPTTKSRSSTFSTARIAAPGNGSRETNVRNSESHGRGVVLPERPPVDPDLRRATSRARRSYLPRCAICRKTQCGGGSLIPGSSADGLQHPAVAHRYRRHRSWRPAPST